MKLDDYRKSKNFEDRRGMSNTGKVAMGGGIVGVIFLVIQLFLGGDNQQIADAIQQQLNQPSTQQTQTLSPEEQAIGEFVSQIVASTEDVWHRIFQNHNFKYKEPKLVLFSGATSSGCGTAQSSTGPFYCPSDQTVYMDLGFFETLRTRFGAKKGDFAIAYVIAHEVGHHVQNQLGILRELHSLRQSGDSRAQKAQIAMELQADFYAGVWAHFMQNYLSEGDIEEALSAAAAVGDDNIQNQTQGYVVEESFTHGSSEQRMYWFSKGFKTGDIESGDTFNEIR
ncbi:MAG: neutral zinc metallopeptidase [Saprospiraceae bacterium]